MPSNYVLVAFATSGSPPDARILNSAYEGLVFAPLTTAGLIYTVDRSLWRQGEIVPRELTDSFCPQIESIRSAIEFSRSEKSHFVAGLATDPEYFPPGSQGASIHLQAINVAIPSFVVSGFPELGFDVVDQWTGISALANVGYSAGDAHVLSSLGLTSTPYGLLSTVEHAAEFARVAAKFVKEHAPLIPVCVRAILAS